MVDEGLGAGRTGKQSGTIKGEQNHLDTEVNETGKMAQKKDVIDEGKGRYWMDVDRMVNEGLGGGRVGKRTGKIEESRPLEEETDQG